MAFLKKYFQHFYFFLILAHGLLSVSSILLHSTFAFCSVEKITPLSLRAGSWQALHHCDWAKATFWAKLLDRSDRQTAILYRLAWFQIPYGINSKAPYGINNQYDGSNPLNDSDDLTSPWQWQNGSELWKDEWTLVNSTSNCAMQGRPKSISYSKIPLPILDALLFRVFQQNPSSLSSSSSSSSSLKSLHPPFDRILRSYVLYQWLHGRTIPLNSEWIKNHVQSKNGPSISCDWAALALLHSSSEKKEEWTSLLNQCKSESGLLWAVIRLQTADLLFKNGKMDNAFQLYREALDLLSDHPMPPSLKYRLAVSGFLSHTQDDFTFRLTSEILSSEILSQDDLRGGLLSLGESPEDSEVPPLEPLYRNVVQNLACDRLTALKPQEALKLFSRIFRPTQLINQSLKLTQDCPHPEDIVPIWMHLLSVAKAERGKAHLLGLLLKAFLSSGHPQALMKSYTLKLAAISKANPFVASHEFWNALLPPLSSPSQHSPHFKKRAIELVHLYRSHSQWLDRDEFRFKKLVLDNSVSTSQDSGSSLDSTQAFQTDSQAAPQPISLPMLGSLPPLSLKVEIPVDFIQALGQEFQYQTSSQGSDSRGSD